MRVSKEISFGDRARAARTKLGLNQDEVAERVGISTEVYGRFERGVVTPRLQTLLKLCDVLSVTPNDLLIGELATTGDVSDIGAAKLRQLAAVLEGADAVTIRRVTEVARWLRPTEQVERASRAAERRGLKWGARPAKQRSRR